MFRLLLINKIGNCRSYRGIFVRQCHFLQQGDKAKNGFGARNGESQEDYHGEEKSQAKEAKSHTFGLFLAT